MNRSRLLPLILLAALPLVGGCLPTVVWLPDGSGFVYTEKNWSRLVHFDLESGTRTVLVEDTGTQTVLPAVSPDGNSFAVALAEEADDGKYTVRVIRYDRQGKELKRSKHSPPGTVVEAPPTPIGFTAALAIPDGRIAVHLAGDPGVTWLYDPEKDSFAGPVPQDVYAWLAGFAIRPDGMGILTAEEGTEDESTFKLQFRTWDGGSREIRSVEGSPEDVIALSATGLAEWDGATCRIVSATAELTVDTDELTVRVRPVGRLHVPDTENLVDFHIFPEGPGRLCFFHRIQLFASGGNQGWLDFHDMKTQKSRRLAEGVQAFKPLSPSPDGELVAARVLRTDPDQDQILVVDREGKVQHRVDVFTTRKDYGLGE